MGKKLQETVVTILIVLAVAGVPASAYAWSEHGGTSSVDPTLEANGCEFCHSTAPNPYPYSRRAGVHGGYTSSSDDCNSCHQVHDAVGVTLLSKVTATQTCLMCHDGTGGFGVYGTIKARTGSEPAGAHSAISDRTAVVPGGATSGGSRTETQYSDGFLGCVDCHSPHGSGLVDAFSTERARYEKTLFGYSTSANLLKKHPNGSVTTSTVYGSAWCAGCHQGRHSDGTVLNHPVDSGTYSYGNVPLAPWGGVVDISCNPTNGNVFVADPGNRSVKKFTSAGGYTGKYTMWNGVRLNEPRGVSVAAGNLLWVGDPRMGYFALFNQDFGAFGASNPHLRPGYRGLAGSTYDLTAAGAGTNPAGTRIVVTDTEANVVQVRDSDTVAGNVVFCRPAGASGPNQYPSSRLGEFNAPTDAAIGPSGTVYVVDSLNNRIQRFDSTGVVIDAFGSYGSASGQFDRPLSVAVDAAGRVYVADSGNHRIQRFSATGVFEASFGTLGSGQVQFRLPSGVAVNEFNGNIYVVDAGNARVQVISAAGLYVNSWGTEGAADTQFAFRPAQIGPMAYVTDRPYPESPLRQMYQGLVYAGRGYVMEDPRTAAQAGHGPLCQQCHEDARNVGALYDGLAVPAPEMVVRDGVADDPSPTGERDRANPRFQNFPHETSTLNMLVETGDDLCTNCHAVNRLP